MKKRILSLAALLAFTTCFTGCDAANGAWDKVTGAWDKVYDKVTDLIPGLNKPDDVEYDAEGAADWLLSLEEEKPFETRNDYSLPNTWNFRNVTYTIEWSVAETTAVTLERGETETLVKVNKMLPEDTDYVLTAKVIAGDGTFAEITLERTILAMATTVAAPIPSAPVEGVMYKYHVYQAGAQQDCYFVGKMDGYYFKTSSKYEDAVDLYVEYVAGSTTDFYLCFDHPEDKSKQYIGVKVSDDGAHNNIVFDEEPVSTFVWNATLGGGTITTTILDKDGNMSEFYLGNYSKDDGSKHYTTVSASTIDNASASTSNIGHLVGLVSVEDVKASEKLAQAQRNYGLSKFFFGTGTYELPTANETFPDVTYTYEISGEGATLEGNVISYAAGTEDKTATLKVTFNCGDETALTKECTFTVSPIPTVPAAGELTIAEALALDLVAYGNGYNGGKTTEIYTITGVVTSIKKAWDPAYNNMEVYMSESLTGTTSILVYRLSTQVEVGDKIVVTGKLGYYSGSVQVAQGATAEIIGKETLPEAPSIPATWPVLEENTAYKFYIAPATLESKPYYFDGTIKSSRYLNTTEKAADAVDVFVEKSATTAGYSFYFMVGEAKNYINVTLNAEGKTCAAFVTENPAVYAYNEAGKVWYTNVDGTDYYFGTYDSKGTTYTTLSASKLSYINADNTGVSQFPAMFVLSSEVVEPSMPATWPVLEENTAYKFYIAPATLESKPYYFDGTIKSSRYLNTTENAANAVDVFVEKSTKPLGYSFYFMVGETKNYINVTLNAEGKTCAAFVTENPAVYAYNEAGKVWYTNVDGTDYYFGTYDSKGTTYTTLSASKLSYINADNTGVSQFPAMFVLSSETELSDEEKIAFEKNALTVETSVVGDKTITLPATGNDFENVTITWAVSESDYATYADGVLTLTQPVLENATVTLTATLACGDKNDTKTFEITLIAGEPVYPETWPQLQEGTAYRYFVEQKNIGATYYFNGKISGKYLSSTVYASEAADVYVEKAATGYSFYFMNGSTKTYINLSTTEKAVVLATENPTVYAYNPETKAWWAKAGSLECYIGTYNSYNTFSASETSYIKAENTGKTQFPAQFAVAADVADVTEAAQVAFELSKLAVDAEVTGAKEINLTNKTSVYSKASISWGLAASDYATLSGNKLTITNPAQDTTITVTATVTCGTVTEEKEFTIAIKHLSDSITLATETFKIAATKGTLAADKLSITWASDNFNFVGEKASSQTAIRTSDSDHFRVYQGSKFTISGKNNQQITQVVVKLTSSDYAKAMVNSLKTSGVTATQTTTSVTFKVDSGSISSLTFTATAQFRIQNFEITYIA